MGRNRKPLEVLFTVLIVSAWMEMLISAWADEFTKKDLARWNKEFMTVVNKDEKLCYDSKLEKNKVSYCQCHPNGANTHPETYPKFQKQIGRVISLFEMVNWCICNPLEGESLAADDPKMVALLAYITNERRG